MYVADKVGMPVYGEYQSGGSTGALSSLNIGTLAAITTAFNVANAAPVSVYGTTVLGPSGTFTPASRGGQFMLGQSFVLPAPKSGKSVGVELCGWIGMVMPEDITIVPSVYVAGTIPGTAMTGALTGTGKPIAIGEPRVGSGTGYRFCVARWKERFVVKDKFDQCYVNGAAFYDPASGAGVALGPVFGRFTVRTLDAPGVLQHYDPTR